MPTVNGFHITCSACGKRAVVGFKPDSKRRVTCDACFKAAMQRRCPTCKRRGYTPEETHHA